MTIYTDLLQALKGERLSSVFSPDGTLIYASAAPHCGAAGKATRISHGRNPFGTIQLLRKKKKKNSDGLVMERSGFGFRLGAAGEVFFCRVNFLC